MEAVQTLFLMGGYGAFVWPAYVLTAVVMIWLAAMTWTRLRATERALEALQTRPASPAPQGGIGGADAPGTRP